MRGEEFGGAMGCLEGVRGARAESRAAAWGLGPAGRVPSVRAAQELGSQST